MTTSTLEVRDQFSILGAHGIEKRLRRLAGVGRVSVNPVSGSTTVLYDPEKASLASIAEAIEGCGFHCAGEALPRHARVDHFMPGNSRPDTPIDEIKPVYAPARKQAT